MRESRINEETAQMYGSPSTVHLCFRFLSLVQLLASALLSALTCLLPLQVSPQMTAERTSES